MSEPTTLPRVYGDGDASFQAAGGETGLWLLVRDFYRLMNETPRFARLRGMHPADIEVSIDKLARFLCGWLGGPPRYSEKYGPIRLPMVHAHLPIVVQDRDDWLECMRQALVLQPFADDFREYLMIQFARPADRIVTVCAHAATRRSG
ncbi:MAG: group II truncated hemoglobin [Burkholderiaceae bacterium]